MENKTTENHKISQKTLDKQNLFLAAYKSHRWNVTAACREAGIDRGRYYDWMEQPEFAEKVEHAKQDTIDFVEQKLFDQIESNSAACTIFYLKCQGKKRGYIEKEEKSEHDSNVNWSEVGAAFARVASGIATKKPE
jgi:excinuclease UvrABC nuclease subunit